MAELLNYTPPCLRCRISGDEGPHFDRFWKVLLKEEHDGICDLYGSESTQPNAWVHRSCLFDFLLNHATKAEGGVVRFPKLCIICEVDLHADTLWRLCFRPDPDCQGRTIWVHPDCIRGYYLARQSGDGVARH